MARTVPDDEDALRLLRELIGTIGASHVVYLLAQIADEQRDLAAAAGDAHRARRMTHDARLLGDAAIRLLE